MLQHTGPESATGAFFHRDQQVVTLGQLRDQRSVEWLGEAGIGHCDRQSLRLEKVGSIEAFAEPGAERQECDVIALPDNAPLADLERFTPLGQRHAGSLAARVPERDRPGVVCGGGGHHVDQFGLVGRCHHREAREVGQVGDVECARMGRSVGAHKAGAINGKTDRQTLQGDIMDDLVIGALQKGRIDRAERFHSRRCQSGGKGHAMLFGNTHIEHPLGMSLCKHIETGSRCHRRGDGDDSAVPAGFFGQRVGKYLGVARGTRFGFGKSTGFGIEASHSMILVGTVLRRGIACTLARDRVNEDRAIGDALEGAQNRQKLGKVVSVDRADIGKAHVFEKT